MPVSIVLRKERWELEAPVSVGDALRRLDLPPERYLVIRDGILVDEHEMLNEGDSVRLVSVISGGRST